MKIWKIFTRTFHHTHKEYFQQKIRKKIELPLVLHNREQNEENRENFWTKSRITAGLLSAQFIGLAGYVIYTFGQPEESFLEDDLAGEPIWKQYIQRTYRRLDSYRKMLSEPARTKLLPDPLAYPYVQPKHTLVLELKNVLVHPDWTYNTGWRFKKRPGLDYFLESLHGLYEIVIYTAEQAMTVYPLMEALDPKNLIAYKLARDDTHYVAGHYVKRLDRLNRDLTKVIVIDWDGMSVKFHRDNLLKILKWNGRDDDVTLIDLAAFLQTIAENEVDDVREVLKYYSEYEDPVQAFRDKQKELIGRLEDQVKSKKLEESENLAKSINISDWFTRNRLK